MAGTMSLQGSSLDDARTNWDAIPAGVLEAIARVLPAADVASARLACSHWRSHFYMHVDRGQLVSVSLHADPLQVAALAACVPQLHTCRVHLNTRVTATAAADQIGRLGQLRHLADLEINGELLMSPQRLLGLPPTPLPHTLPQLTSLTRLSLKYASESAPAGLMPAPAHLATLAALPRLRRLSIAPGCTPKGAANFTVEHAAALTALTALTALELHLDCTSPNARGGHEELAVLRRVAEARLPRLQDLYLGLAVHQWEQYCTTALALRNLAAACPLPAATRVGLLLHLTGQLPHCWRHVSEWGGALPPLVTPLVVAHGQSPAAGARLPDADAAGRMGRPWEDMERAAAGRDGGAGAREGAAGVAAGGVVVLDVGLRIWQLRCTSEATAMLQDVLAAFQPHLVALHLNTDHAGPLLPTLPPAAAPPSRLTSLSLRDNLIAAAQQLPRLPLLRALRLAPPIGCPEATCVLDLTAPLQLPPCLTSLSLLHCNLVFPPPTTTPPSLPPSPSPPPCALTRPSKHPRTPRLLQTRPPAATLPCQLPRFPPTLASLHLHHCRTPWSHLRSLLGALPSLTHLTLEDVHLSGVRLSPCTTHSPAPAAASTALAPAPAVKFASPEEASAAGWGPRLGRSAGTGAGGRRAAQGGLAEPSLTCGGPLGSCLAGACPGLTSLEVVNSLERAAAALGRGEGVVGAAEVVGWLAGLQRLRRLRLRFPWQADGEVLTEGLQQALAPLTNLVAVRVFAENGDRAPGATRKHRHWVNTVPLPVIKSSLEALPLADYQVEWL